MWAEQTYDIQVHQDDGVKKRTLDIEKHIKGFFLARVSTFSKQKALKAFCSNVSRALFM